MLVKERNGYLAWIPAENARLESSLDVAREDLYVKEAEGSVAHNT